MKKKCECRSPRDRLLKKMMLMAKLTSLFILIFTWQMSASVYSQTSRLSLDMSKTTIKGVLQQIEDQTEFRFIYENDKINLDEEISIQVQNEKVVDILNDLFKDQPVSYKITESKMILIKPGGTNQAGRQTKGVSGKVSDSSGQPLPGVSIVIKGTATGTITDFGGNFSLNDVPDHAILVFSFVGMKIVEISVAGQAVIDITMEEDAIGIEEVVAVGYSTKKRRDLTGSISSVSAEELSKSKSESFAQSLQGNVSGVYVKSNSGQPGGGISVRVRGIGGLNNSEPLYVIDGVQSVGSESETFNPLTSLNPNDIESIEVLKDASSAAIYGARGANGVIIITTKRGGADGKPKLSYSGYVGVQSLLNVGDFDVLNAREYAEIVNATVINDGGDPVFGGPNTSQYPPGLFPSPPSLGEGYNHFDAIFKTAPVQEHQLGISGGNEKSQYYLSLNYLNQEGIIETTSFDRVTMRFNSDNEIFKFLKVGNSFGLSRSNSTLPSSIGRQTEGGTITLALVTAPTVPIFNEDGSYAGPPTSFYLPTRTPRSLLDNIDRNDSRTSFSGNIYMQLDILKGLSFKSNLGFGISQAKTDRFEPTYSEGIVSSNIAIVNENYSEGSSYQWSNFLTYNIDLGDHRISALGGMEALENEYSFMSGNATYSDNAIKIVSSSGALTSNVNQFKGSSSLLSYFGNISYNYKSKYYLESNIRRDGSSRFGENNKWGVFPSLSAAWRISEENFFNVSFIDDLKVRGSYGEVGNDKIGDFAYIASIKSVFYAFGGNNGSFSNGQAIDALGNTDLRWETSKQTNFGIDLTMFNNKWSFTAEYFKTNIEDMLLGIPIPATTGISNSTGTVDLSTVIANAGALTNEGFEFETSYNNKIGEVSYKIGANLTTYKNEVTDISNNEQIWGATIQGQNVSRTVVGGNMGEFYGYVVEGIFQEQAEVDAANKLGDPSVPYQNANTAPGDFRFKDLNGDHMITDLDREVIGSPVPDFTYGLNLDLAYKNFELSMLWYGVQGVDIYNANRMDLEASGRTNFNKSKTVLNAWSGPGTSNTIPRRIASDPNQNKRVSSVFVEDGSFLALRNVRLSYSLPESFIQQLSLSGASVFVSAQNYLVFTKYSGFDPEVGNIGGNNLGAGIDYDFYPKSKTIQLGLNINF